MTGLGGEPSLDDLGEQARIDVAAGQDDAGGQALGRDLARQQGGQGDPANRSDDIHDIATNGGEVMSSLDDAGIDFIEGGFAGSNPADRKFFELAAKERFAHARVVAFGSTRRAELKVADDPQQVTLDCRHLSFVDYSAIAALKTLRERYSRAGKHLRVVHLSERCKQLLKRAGAHD